MDPDGSRITACLGKRLRDDERKRFAARSPGDLSLLSVKSLYSLPLFGIEKRGLHGPTYES